MFDDAADNVLLEIETALRLHKRRLLGILPLLVGTHNASVGVHTASPTDISPPVDPTHNSATVDVGAKDVSYTPYSSFDVSRFPNGPSKTNTKVAVRDTLRQLFKFQGIFVHPTQVGWRFGCNIHL